MPKKTPLFLAQPDPVQSPKKMHGPLGLVFSGLVGFVGLGYCDKPAGEPLNIFFACAHPLNHLCTP